MTKLFSPPGYKTASVEELAEICNGCGAADSKFDFVPDTIWGLKITEVCNIHDYMYHYGRSLEDKEEADRVMLNNSLRLIEAQSNRFMKPLRRRRALKYYEAVTSFGAPAFWQGKENGL